MAGKFKIAQDPTFTAPVTIARAGGGTIEVGFTFKYRTQSEIAELLEEWELRRKDVAEELETKGEELSMKQRVELKIGIEAKEVADLVSAWEFDDECNEDSSRRLLQSSITALDSIKKAYFEGLNPARLGN
ncbi:phage tail assembly chaperone [Pseudomonas sp. YH-1]|uniref:phage tail assembly chaperone n=1 Tax=Pseudomonas sp. YH-1 TaxID=3384787 RepID=UPI003F818572